MAFLSPLVNVSQIDYLGVMTKEQFKAARARLGMSQSEIAAALGVTTVAVKHWEQGRRGVSVPMAKLLATLKPKKAKRA